MTFTAIIFLKLHFGNSELNFRQDKDATSITAYNHRGIFISDLSSHASPWHEEVCDTSKREAAEIACGCECVHQEIPRVSV